MTNNQKTDYHNFTTIDTPVEERRRLNIGDVWENKIQCLNCNDIIMSVNKHDFVYCRCGKIAVDGGSWYKSRAGDIALIKDLSVMFKNL